MSRCVNTQDYTTELLRKIAKDSTVKKEPSKYAIGAPPTMIKLWHLEDNRMYIPFAYNTKASLPTIDQFSRTSFKFTGSLRDNQKVVKNEAIQHLNKTGSTLISAHVGFGKCLGYNTPVIMYDGSIKMVQNVKKGDILMGDDSTPRTVIGTCYGIEQMYTVVPEHGDPFTCNGGHLLSLKNVLTGRTEEIEMRNFIYLDYEDRRQYRLYRNVIQFPNTTPVQDAYQTGMQLTPDQPTIPTEYKCNTINTRLDLIAGLVDQHAQYVDGTFLIRKKFANSLYQDIKYVCLSLAIGCKKESNGDILIYGQNARHIPTKQSYQVDRKTLPSTQIYNFEYQPSTQSEYYGFSLDGNKRFLLGDFTVTHNTALSTYLSSKIGLKTMVLCHRIVLIKQWQESFNRFCPSAKVQILTTKDRMDPETDIFIMNASNVPKKLRSFYSDIGLLIVDEAHVIMAEQMSACMKYFTPRYVIGLTATPYRTDGLDKMLDLYFGKQKIIRELYRPHTVYRVNTGFKPDVKLTRLGKLDWGSVLNSQADNEDRNRLILDIIEYFSERFFLVLCKRVSQAKYLGQQLIGRGIDTTLLVGSKQTFDADSRVLIGTCSKVGVGFDHPKLDTLLIAADIEQYFIQYLGRVFRRQDSEPMIFDLVDDHGVLKKHYNTRQKTYLKHGGMVEDFDQTVLDDM